MAIRGRISAAFPKDLELDMTICLTPYMDLAVLSVVLALHANLPVPHQQLCMPDTTGLFKARQGHHRACLWLREHSAVFRVSSVVP